MAVPEVEEFFTRLIMRVAPKSYAQANGEVVVTRRFLENFSGDCNRSSGSTKERHSRGWWGFGILCTVSHTKERFWQF